MQGHRIGIALVFVALQGLVACKDQPAPTPTTVPAPAGDASGVQMLANPGSGRFLLKPATNTWEEHHTAPVGGKLVWKANKMFTVLFDQGFDPCNPTITVNKVDRYPATPPSLKQQEYTAKCTVVNSGGPYPYGIDPSSPMLVAKPPKPGKHHPLGVTPCKGCLVEIDSDD
jgi:hypothetical protein